jgi:hypothetical protein
MLKREKRKMEKETEFLLKHDIARLSRAITLIKRVLKNVENIKENNIAVPMKLYCSVYETKSVKNILERLINGKQVT